MNVVNKNVGLLSGLVVAKVLLLGELLLMSGLIILCILVIAHHIRKYFNLLFIIPYLEIMKM